MSQTLLNLFNQALGAIGSATSVTDPDADTSTTKPLKLWFPVARHAVFTANYWNSIRTQKLLARVSERDVGLDWANGNPAPGFLYSYSLPSDILHPQYMEDFSPFRLGRVGTSRLIFSNNTSPILCYTMDDMSPENWEPDLYRCVIWALAACINMNKSGKMALTQKLEQQVTDMILEASTNSANAEDQYFDAVPSFYAGTDFSPPINTSRFLYPTSSFRVEGLSA
jgi:hypothetical protein